MRSSARFRILLVLALSWLAAACAEGSREPVPDATEFLTTDYFYPTPESSDAVLPIEKIVYVPVYSHLYLSGLGRRDLAITLSIRNTDVDDPILIDSVRYYDSAGQLLENYLAERHTLAPLATVELVIDQLDTRGGSGANFIVEWGAEQAVSEPIIETIMVGITGTQGLSFSRNGQVIEDRSQKQ